MSDFRPKMGARPVLTAISLVCFGLFGSVALVSSQTPDSEALRTEAVPDRYSVVLKPQAPTPTAEDAVAPTAEDAVLAKREEGKALQMGASKADHATTQTSGVLSALGTGLGGGGTKDGLGGLGSKGSGMGASGHGSGSGRLRDGGGLGAVIGAKGIQAHSGLSLGGMQARTSIVQLPPPRTGMEAPQQDVLHRDASPANTLAERKTQSRAPLTQTAVDATSTFAADVDTGSYTYARRMIRSGQLPTPESVRVEEFINFFRYDYAQPEGARVLGVTSELVPHPSYPGRHLLTLGVQAKTVAQDDRKPVRLTFLVDTSGSMRGTDRLGLAQRAMKHALLGLGDEDTVAIVTYSGSTGVALPPTPATRRGEIRAAITRLQSGGGTAMDSGMALAYQQAEASYADGAENRVIVLSDGDANIGRTHADDMLKTIRRHAEGGITLTTMGFGTGNYKDARMERLADAGDGAYVYIDGWSEVERVFGKQLGATLETVGRDVKLQLELDPTRVKSWRQVGYINRQIADEDFRDDAVDAGEVGSGHQVTALYELELRGGVTSVGELHLRVKPPGPDRPATEWSTSLTRSKTSQPSADTRTALAAMHLADGLHDRDPEALKRSLEEAQALQAAGRHGATELAELSRLALGLVKQASGPVANR